MAAGSQDVDSGMVGDLVIHFFGLEVRIYPFGIKGRKATLQAGEKSNIQDPAGISAASDQR
jgi:hypothetical protein